MRSPLAALVAVLALATLVATPLVGQEFQEPKSKVAFSIDEGDLVLLGTGLRVKKITFIKVKVYATGFYVDKSAVDGLLAPFKGKPASDELRTVLQTGDFAKMLVLHFVRNVGAGKIQDAMRDALEEGTDPKVLEQFISYFPEVKDGQRCTFRWVPGGTVETVMAGEEKPPITDAAFAAKLFGLYVGPEPLQDDFKAGFVARAGEVLAD
jgi:hypothetical protein